MPPIEKLSLPFLTRDMLDFQEGRTFSLRLVIRSPYTGSTITISGITKAGPFVYSHITVAGTALNTQDYRIPDAPIFISVNDPAGDFNVGDVFVAIQLLIDDTVMTELCSGFVYSDKSVTYPIANQQNPRPGGGALIETASSDPAAGAQHNFTLASDGPIKINQLKVRLVTDANAANRTAHFKFAISGGVTFDYISQTVQTASQTIDYILAPFGYQPTALAATIVYVPIPVGIHFQKSTTFTTTIDNGQATDNWGVATVSRELFLG